MDQGAIDASGEYGSFETGISTIVPMSVTLNEVETFTDENQIAAIEDSEMAHANGTETIEIVDGKPVIEAVNLLPTKTETMNDEEGIASIEIAKMVHPNGTEVEETVDRIPGIEVEDVLRIDKESFDDEEGIAATMDGVDGSSYSNTAPLLRLVFKDSKTFAELRSVISTCIRDTLFARKQPIEVSVKDDEFSVYFNELDTGDGQNDSIFMIDTLPTEDENPKKEIPVYEATNQNAMLNNDRPNGSDEDSTDKPKNNCWNCGGDHMLRECPKPRDSNQINRAKNAFIRSKTERYHLEGDKFGHFVPGHISNELREALGVRQREVPSFIYRMRLYGYPPGWLEDAKVTRSGLSLFISETKQSTDQNLEAGEIGDKITYDPNRFITYPGFNAELPRDIHDDSHYHNVPPMQAHQSREAMLHHLQDNLVKSYKRKKLKHVIDMEKTSGDNSVDMEIANSDDDGDDCESPDSPPPGIDNPTASSTIGFDSPMSPPPVDAGTPVVKKTNISINSLEDVATPESPSLIELQRQKRALLQALAESNDTNLDDSLLNDMMNKTIDNSTVNESTFDTQCSTPASSSRLSQVNDGTPLGNTKSVVCGTPLLKTASPYSKLPEGASWSAGVCDVIDFENLPDSIGTYDKLSGLIRKVRTVVSQINEANDAEDDDD